MKINLLTPEQITAVVWKPDGLFLATFLDRTLDGLPRIETKFFADPADLKLQPQTLCLTAPKTFNFQTRQLLLDKLTLEMNDAEIGTYLIQVEQNGIFLGDGKPLLDSTLEETVAQMTRLPNETVALTQLPRTELDAVQEPTKNLFFTGLDGDRLTREEGRFEKDQVKAETPLRAIVRAFLCETKPQAGSGLSVFIIADETGFAFGLWNSASGLFFERSESLPKEFADESGDNSYLQDFLYHTLDTAIEQAHEISLAENYSGLERVFICVPTKLIGMFQPMAEEAAEIQQIPIEVAAEPLEEMTARGLLYGVINDNPLPISDLCRDLYARSLDNSLEIERAKHAAATKMRTTVAIAILLPFVLLGAFIVSGMAHYARQSAFLAIRQRNAVMEEKRLKPILDARNSYVQNFQWRESFVRQILSLRDRQTLAISFLPEVDGKTVLANDGKFAFSELKMNVNGAWSMRGVAESEESVTNFIRGLEYARNEKDVPIFTDLAPEIKLGTNKTAQNAVYKSSLNVPEGWLGWEIKGNYVPLASMAPKPVAPNQPPPNQPQNAPNAPNNQLNPSSNEVKK